jgi:histone H3
LDILGHDGHTLGVNGTQVGIFEKTNKVGLGRFLEGKNGSGLETEVSLEVLSNLTDKTLEGGLRFNKRWKENS